jgi:hypothetical protein
MILHFRGYPEHLFLVQKLMRKPTSDSLSDPHKIRLPALLVDRNSWVRRPVDQEKEAKKPWHPCQLKSRPSICCVALTEAAEKAYPGRNRIDGHCVQYMPIAQSTDLSATAAL